MCYLFAQITLALRANMPARRNFAQLAVMNENMIDNLAQNIYYQKINTKN